MGDCGSHEGQGCGVEHGDGGGWFKKEKNEKMHKGLRRELCQQKSCCTNMRVWVETQHPHQKLGIGWGDDSVCYSTYCSTCWVGDSNNRGNLGGGWSCPYPQHCWVETSGSWEPVDIQPKTKWWALGSVGDPCIKGILWGGIVIVQDTWCSSLASVGVKTGTSVYNTCAHTQTHASNPSSAEEVSLVLLTLPGSLA